MGDNGRGDSVMTEASPLRAPTSLKFALSVALCIEADVFVESFGSLNPHKSSSCDRSISKILLPLVAGSVLIDFSATIGVGVGDFVISLVIKKDEQPNNYLGTMSKKCI